MTATYYPLIKHLDMRDEKPRVRDIVVAVNRFGRFEVSWIALPTEVIRAQAFDTIDAANSFAAKLRLREGES